MVIKRRVSKVSSVPVRGFSKNRKQYSAKTELMTFNQPTYTDTELEYFEDAWATTVAGKALDLKMEFVIGGVITPIFELRKTTKENGDEMS